MMIFLIGILFPTTFSDAQTETEVKINPSPDEFILDDDEVLYDDVMPNSFSQYINDVGNALVGSMLGFG